MTVKKSHGRARTSSLYIAMHVPHDHNYKVLFRSSILPLCEMIGLRSDLMHPKKIVYFHENQLEFPVTVTKARDFQYGFNEILTWSKCKVIYYPLSIREIDKHMKCGQKLQQHIVHSVAPWREFDKNPQQLHRVLSRLDDHGFNFKVSILGESFSEKPEVFIELHDKFKDSMLHCGYIENSLEYYKVLKNCHVVVSTAKYTNFLECLFYSLEAVYCGCVPVVPNRLSYKELYTGKVQEVYNTEEELYQILTNLCNRKQNGQPLNIITLHWLFHMM